MPKFRHCEIWSDWQYISGSKRLAYVSQLNKASDGCVALFAVEDDETQTVRLPASAAAQAFMAVGLVLVVRFADESFVEWRIDSIEKTRTTWLVTAKSVLADLTDDELLIDGNVNGFPSFAGGMADVTATEVVEAALAHPRAIARGLPDWLVPGQIDCTTILENVAWDTAGVNAILRATQAAVRSTGERCEVRLRPDAVTRKYLIDLVREIGSDVPVVTLVDGRNLVGDLAATELRRDQSTVVIVRGGDLGGFSTGIGLSRWTVTAIAGAVVTLADPAGGVGPVIADDQYNGGALYHEASGDLLAITDTSAASQTVTLASVGTLAVDDRVQFRTTADPTTATPIIEVVDPARVATYGRKVGSFKRESVIGVPNLAPNGVLRTWSDPSTKLPDGWRFASPFDLLFTGATDAPAPIASGGFITIARNTDARYTQVGGQSLQFDVVGGTLISPPIRGPAWYPGMPMSVLVSLLLSTWSRGPDLIRIMIGIELADGSIHPWWENSRALQLQPANTRPAPIQTVPANAFLRLELSGSDITAPSTVAGNLRPNTSDIAALSVDAKGVVVLIQFASDSVFDGQRIAGYLDALMVTPSLVAPPTLSENGGSNTLHQTGNLVLSEVSTPLREVTTSALDLERDNPGLVADTLAKGATVRVPSPLIPPDDQLLRIIQLKPDYLRSKATQVTLSSRRRLLTDLLVNADAGASFSGGTTRGLGSGTSGTPPTSGGGTSPTPSGGISAPTLDSSLDTSNNPTIIAIVDRSVTSVKIALTVNSADYPTDADVRAVTADTSPFTHTFSGLGLVSGDVVKAAAFAYNAFGVESPKAFHAFTVATATSPVATDLLIWLRADQELYQDTTKTTASTADGDFVRVWGDLSGNGNDAVVPGSGTGHTSQDPVLRLGVVNGRPATSFDDGGGTNQSFQLPNLDALALAEGEMFVVFRASGDPPSGGSRIGPIGHFGANDINYVVGFGATSATFLPFTDGVVYDDFGSTTLFTVGDLAEDLSTDFRIYSVYSAANDWQCFLNGVSKHTESTNTVGWANPGRLGCAANGGFIWSGKIAEFIMYSRKLTTAERTANISYLKARYGISP